MGSAVSERVGWLRWRAVAYIAGPYRSTSAWGVAQNVRAAEAVAWQVWREGIAVLCPHANTAHFDGSLPDETFLAGTMTLLERCDMVVVCEGWEHSTGTRAEIEAAGRLGIPVFYAEDPEWAERARASARAVELAESEERSPSSGRALVP